MMGRLKLIVLTALAPVVLGASGCQPADDSDLMSPENDINVTSPSPLPGGALRTDI